MTGYSDAYRDAYAFYSDGSGYLSYDPALSRVLVDLAAIRALVGSNATTTIQRSTDTISWANVRGGSGVSLTTTALPLSDYEFTPDVPNYYRAVVSSVIYPATITPALGSPWLKSIRFPFLNMPATISDVSDITRPAGPGADPWRVLGESLYHAAAVMRGSRQFTLTVAVEGDDAAAALATLLETGDTLLVQTPATYTIPLTGYYFAGDTVETRQDVAWDRRWVDIPCTEVVPPSEDVVGPPGTWATVVADYASWAVLVTDLDTWTDVGELVGAPSDVIVS